MTAMASQTTGVSMVCSTACSGTDQRKHQSSASLAFVMGNSPATGEFPSQRASNAENVSIWWRHHDLIFFATSKQSRELYLPLHESWQSTVILLKVYQPIGRVNPVTTLIVATRFAYATTEPWILYMNFILADIRMERIHDKLYMASSSFSSISCHFLNKDKTINKIYIWIV